MLNDVTIKTKFWLIFLVSITGVVLLMLYEMSKFRSQMVLSRENELIHLVESTLSLVKSVHAQQDILGKDAAQQQALKLIKQLRYDDGKGYFWINDYDARIVMHPINPDLTGKDMSNFKDPNGTKLFSEFARVASTSGSGHVRYMWEVPGSKVPEPKSSYVAAFAPWGWVIGTGVYMNDIDSMFWAEVRVTGFLIAIGCVVIGFLIHLIAKNMIQPIEAIVASMKRFAHGDLTDTRIDKARADEIGTLQQSLQQMLSAFRDMVSHSQQDVQRLSAAADELSAVSNTTDAAILRQFEESDCLASATEELAATAVEVGKNAADTATLTREANANVGLSWESMRDTIDTISTLSQDIESATETVNRLELDIRQIDGILDVIRNISDQTNLLALNAAIEAARAGESGRGFAVVADEVRTLAQRTHESTEEIHRMTENLQSQSRSAVDIMNLGKEHSLMCVEKATKTGERLSQVADQVSEVSDKNLVVASAVEEQSAVAEEINRNITSIRDIAQETRNESEKLNERGKELKAMTTQTIQMLSNYTL